MASMLSGGEGRFFNLGHGRGTHRGWSRVVWDLLRETGRLDASKYAGGGIRRQLSFLVGELNQRLLVEIDPAWTKVKFEAEEPPLTPEVPKTMVGEDAFGGIPVIIIDLESAEEAT